jgi:membrane associated rhomboid family serine protease
VLIVPLHRRMAWGNAPLITLALVLVNCLVFALLQRDDTVALHRASTYYAQADLAAVEGPAYIKWLHELDRKDDREKLAELQREPSRALELIQRDEKFLGDLDDDKIIVPDSPEYAQWKPRRLEFERLLDDAFTMRHSLRFSHLEPQRIFWAMFMHGGAEHLIGNMIFLIVLGLLVEGALGPAWFLGLYLAGGFGSALVTLAWRYGDHGTALGASGAIAALMGAYCVLWGRRKVRVFYWFFIVFDYVKVPALVLLPFWFGWEVLNLWLNRGAHIGFDAHAGGIACGALLALALRRLGRVRDDFIDEDERHERTEADNAALEQAFKHLGNLDIGKARLLLERLDAETPGQLRVLVALYRCARYSNSPAQLDIAAARVLGFAAKSVDDIRELKNVYDDYVAACKGAPRLMPDVLLRLTVPWLRIGQDAAAETLLRQVGERVPDLPALPAAWYALALRSAEASPQRRARLEYVAQNFAASEFAGKARFLLQQ